MLGVGFTFPRSLAPVCFGFCLLGPCGGPTLPPARPSLLGSVSSCPTAAAAGYHVHVRHSLSHSLSLIFYSGTAVDTECCHPGLQAPMAVTLGCMGCS